jgi:hypothetical protein
MPYKCCALDLGWQFARLTQQQRQGRCAVDLAVKFNVLAVCAVFVFVGAILLGAF